MRLRTLAIVVVALLILASGVVAWSQTVQGVITGTVTDPTGALVPNATVTITNVGTNISQTTTTGSEGSYRFPLVPPGTYTVDVKAANFAEVRAAGIVVEASQTVPFSVKLELAKASQVIEVTSQAPLVQTATSELSTQVDRETIINAALPDRDIFATLPFVAASVTPGLDMSPVSGGARESGTQYMLNGAEDNDNFSEGAINMKPPLESVQDFSIQTNVMSAQYGKPGAVVNANQVSGANKFHGALYEQNRNATLNANDFFYNRQPGNAGTRPKYIRNQFGGIISGPIKKDKTFFSFAYDRFKISSGFSAANTEVPTKESLGIMTKNASPIAAKILSAFPPRTSENTCPGNSSQTGGPGQAGNNNGIDANTGLPWAGGCLTFFDPQTDSSHTYYGRVDHNFSSSDRISFTANIFREAFVDEFGGSPLSSKGSVNGTTNNHFHQFGLTETHSFGSRLVNEVTVAHNRHYNKFVEGDGTATTPEIIIDNQSAGCFSFDIGGPFEGGLVQGFIQDRWGATDNLTWSVGHHSFKFGGGQQYGILYRNWDLGLPGYYEFANLTSVSGACTGTTCPVITPTGDGVVNPTDGTINNPSSSPSPHSNFTGDYPYAQETAIDPRTGAQASAYRHYTYHDYYWFAEDDWKVTSRLTLNLGLRWDRYGAPSEDHGIMAQFTNLGSCNVATDRTCLHNARVNPVSRMWNTNNKDFGPRFGFAWDPFGKGKMAVRGGYGIYYDRIFDNIWSNGAWNPPFYALLDFSNPAGDSVFYSYPASIGPAYNPNGPNGPIPYPGKRVSVRTMDVNMRDSSGQNFYFGVEREVPGGLLLRASYLGSMGRHLPMLENYNRTDGQAYNITHDTSTTPPTIAAVLTNRRPNSLYTGFNYRSNSVSSNYNSLVAEAQKRMGHGLQFQTGYTFSKQLDLNSELFAGCSSVGGIVGSTAPYYYITNTNHRMLYGRGAADHRHAFKFNVTYEVPFLKNEKGFAGHALGGWSIGSFFQLYSGHPIDIHNGRSRWAAQTCADPGVAPSTPGCNTVNYYLDQNGIPFNIGGDYNLVNVLNAHPTYLGSSTGALYKNSGSPADGFFVDNNPIGCGFPGATTQGVPQAAIDLCNTQFGVGTPNALFGNPAYPSGATPYLRFGALGRDVFQGPRFVQMDMSLSKNFRLTEVMNLRFQASAQNLLNHPSFDCMDANLDSSTFGQALCLAQNPGGTTLGAPTSRVMSLSLRLAF